MLRAEIHHLKRDPKLQNVTLYNDYDKYYQRYGL